jgi:hypothetical protein
MAALVYSLTSTERPDDSATATLSIRAVAVRVDGEKVRRC